MQNLLDQNYFVGSIRLG